MVIERNLGNIERVVRLLLGLAIAVWLLSRPDFNGIDLFVTAICVALILNGVFSRCYLWYVLDIDTTSGADGVARNDCETVR